MKTASLLLILSIILLVAAFPVWPHSHDWGYVPSGSMGMVAVVILVLVITGRF